MSRVIRVAIANLSGWPAASVDPRPKRRAPSALPSARYAGAEEGHMVLRIEGYDERSDSVNWDQEEAEYWNQLSAPARDAAIFLEQMASHQTANGNLSGANRLFNAASHICRDRR